MAHMWNPHRGGHGLCGEAFTGIIRLFEWHHSGALSLIPFYHEKVIAEPFKTRKIRKPVT